MWASSGGSWISAIFDEIALEGLEGVTLPSLWCLLSMRLQCRTPVPEQLQQQIWTLLLRTPEKCSFYELPKPRPVMPIYDRCNDMDEQLGVPVVPTECPFLRYDYAPIQDGAIMGNCVDYKTRIEIKADKLGERNAKEATEFWQQRLVVVASQDERYVALTPANVLRPKDLTVQQYVIWEAIGRSRSNGETTVGSWSLINYCKEATVMFYIKNRMLRSQIIASQHYTEKCGNRMRACWLLMLPRFFRFYKSHLQLFIEKLFVELKARDNYCMPASEVPSFLNGHNKTKTLRRLMLTHAFRQVFETKHERLSAISNEPIKKPDRKTVIIQLRNPQLTFDELYETESDNKEDKSGDYVNLKHAYVDMLPEDECLQAIERFGTRGISASELSHYVGYNSLTTRGILKYLLRENVIKDYLEDVGKQRITRYVGTTKAAHVERSNEQLNQTLQQLRCKDEPTMPNNAEIVLPDLPDILSCVRPMPQKYKSYDNEGKTLRQVSRKALIVRKIDEKAIVQAFILRQAIQAEEKDKGFNESICCKSLGRLLQTMREAGILNVYEITLKYQQHMRLYRLVTHPKIDMQHQLLQREIVRLKNNLHFVIDDRSGRTSQETLKERKEAAEKKLSRPARAPAVVSSAASKALAPKLLLARALHEFLFFLINEQDRKPIEMNVELLQQWQRTEPALLPREFLSEWQKKEYHVLPYMQEISWRTFVPPLPIYDNKPAGWLYFMDALERMPLSIFQRLFRLERQVADQLRFYLDHPVRQHYLVKQLGMKFSGLVPRMQLQQLYLNTLRLLNHMGLVQINEHQLGRDPCQRWIYVNRHARIMDTTTSEASFITVNSARHYDVHRFELRSRDDVAQYWAKLQHTCIYTKLGFRKGHATPKGERLKPLTFIGTVEFDQAEANDNGNVPGDQLGAAGLNSILFAHQYRHWSWVKSKRLPTPPRKRLSTSLLKLPKLRKHRVKPRPVASSSTNKSKNYGPRDDIDRDALKNMRTLRVSWTPEEDRILKMGRAVYLFIDAPLPALGLLNVATVCRDVIRIYLCICNKTTQACVRRMQFLMRMKRDIPDVPNWIYAMQTQRQFNELYNDQFLGNLKLEYPIRSEYYDALLVHFAIILRKLHKTVDSSHNLVLRQYLLPDTLEECNRLLTEYTSMEDERLIYYSNPTSETELQITIAQCVLHSTLCSTKDKTLFNLQTFEIYKHFSEDVLNSAFSKARTDGLVVTVKRRNVQMINPQISGPCYLLSSKYRHRLMYLKFSPYVYDAYYAYAQEALDKFYPAVMSNENTRCLELQSPSFSQLLFMGEWLARGFLSTQIQLPLNILTVDTNNMPRQGSSAADRILDHFSCILENAPQTEYAKRLETECSSRQAASRVRFHPANLTYKLLCSPYDQLSKLPLRVMHFFCALDRLNQEVCINFAKLQRRDHGETNGLDLAECPFSCIMRSGNYLNAVERIVYEQRVTLKQLVADIVPQCQLNLFRSGNNTFKLEPGNLLDLMKQLEKHWRQMEQHNEVKDLGKAAAERTLHNLTDWRSICAQLLDYEPQAWEAERTREFEPSMNKEERARIQDVFVVHLPKLQLQLNETQTKSLETVLRKNAEVPRVLLEAELQRKALLDKVLKETYWRYTENTFDTLRPKLLELNFDATAIQHMEDILNYIEQQQLGALAADLRQNFPLGTFLFEALHLLSEHFLVKRVGVASIMYVHKRHIRNWVVHTFHLKRLEREKVQIEVAAMPATPTAVANQKRKLAEQLDQDSEQPSTSKKAKLMLAPTKESIADSMAEGSDENDSRKSKRRRQTNESDSQTAEVSLSREQSIDVIVMRPQPWIRVNGSLNRRVLDRWLSAILSECIAKTGCLVQNLFMRFPHLLPVDLMFLLELLGDLNCVYLMEMQEQAVHLESEYEAFMEQRVTELYEPTLTYVKVHVDALSRLSRFIGDKKYSSEFF